MYVEEGYMKFEQVWTEELTKTCVRILCDLSLDDPAIVRGHEISYCDVLGYESTN